MTKESPVQEQQISRFVLNMKDVGSFSEIRDYQCGADNQLHKSVTHVDLRMLDPVLILCPYSLFKKLYEEVTGIRIVPMPEPETNILA